MNRITAALAGLGLVATFATTVQAQTKWDMPTGYAPTNFHTENVKQFAADVDKATGGKLKITVHDNGSLFKQNEIKRAVQSGQAQAGEFLLPALANEDPMYGIDSVPFLADSYTDAMKLWKVSRSAIEARMAKQGIKVLYGVAWPPQGVYSKKAINSAADLKGVKWRAYSPQTNRIGELLGAQPATIQAAELAQALSTGVVEAHMTSGATGVDIKVWDSMGKGSYYYDAQAWLPKNLVVVNQKAFDGLDKATQDAVLKAAAEAEARGWQRSEARDKSTKVIMEQNGMVIAAPSAGLKADLKKIGATMLTEWEKSAGADAKAVLDAYRK
ncbi:MAG: TRAP transporter substrate-binding protein [Betaproteobacteria bacterium]|nr:TRAP transporter substrate-binding protein [Betaproteobacteria bacterium]